MTLAMNLVKICVFGVVAHLLFHSHVIAQNVRYEPKAENVSISRSDFPSGFKFGVSTAAAQIEGSTTADGRGLSIWDYLTFQHPEKIADRGNTSVATDSYRRWKEDLMLLKDLGVDVYRFSISWTRILPDGILNSNLSRKGIDHYNQIINTLVQLGIKPVVTLLHFDTPQALQEAYGSFLDRKIVNDFSAYAGICFREFGDRVKTWITMNEPFIVAKGGYDMGNGAPNRCSNRTICQFGNSSTEPYIASHYMLLAHAAAVKLYREQYQVKQKGEIGISLVSNYYEPFNVQSKEDIEAQQRVTDMELGWYMDPMVFGDYPAIMKTIVKQRLPAFTEEEKKLMKGSFDFIGYQYYTARYVRARPLNLNAPATSYNDDRFVDVSTINSEGVQIGPRAEGSFVYVYPQGLQKLLEYTAKKYQNPKIYITENGVAEMRNDSLPLKEALNDQHRIQFIKDHLYYLNNAIKNGSNVQVYIHWTLVDDFEWGSGYIRRFGLYFIDWNNNLTRIPKQSVAWYRDFMKPAGKSPN